MFDIWKLFLSSEPPLAELKRYAEIIMQGKLHIAERYSTKNTWNTATDRHTSSPRFYTPYSGPLNKKALNIRTYEMF